MRAPIPSYYDILQVPPDAPATEIRAAYRRMAQRYHPDKSPGNRFASRVMANLNKAYEVLSDPSQRQLHDQWIERKQANAQARPRLSRPAPLPTLHSRTTRWPWYLLFVTISFAVLAVGTVVYKTELASKLGTSRSAR